MEIKDNGVICAAPWSHLYVQPNGNVHPCCTATSIRYGNINEQSLSNIWNGDAITQFRKDLIAGIPQTACEFCYKHEQHTGGHSLRTSLNQKYGDAITLDENDVEFSISYLDVRSSNICNFKCVMCNESLSSAWADDINSLRDLNKNKRKPRNKKYLEINDDTKKEIFKLLPGVKEIYFAGGEPLLTDFHYKILNYLIAKNLTHVVLRYNTNLSVLEYKGNSVLDYWNKFDSVMISASIDMPGERGEYHRKGLDWEQFKDNLIKIRTQCPRIVINPQITLTALSIGYLPDLLSELRGLFTPDVHIDYNFCLGPVFFNPQILPENVKNQYIYNLAIALKQDGFTRYEHTVINSAIEFLQEKVEFSENNFEMLKQYLDDLDKIRYPDTDSYWKSLWPELNEDYYNNFTEYFALLKDKNVLEYASYLDDWWSVLTSYQPKSLTSVNANVTDVAHIVDKASDYNVDYHHCSYEDFKSDRQFDVVICTGLINKLSSPFHLIEHIVNKNPKHVIFETDGEYWPGFPIDTPSGFYLTSTLTEKFSNITLPTDSNEINGKRRLPWVLHTVIPNLVELAFRQLGYEMVDVKNIRSQHRPSKALVCSMLFKRI